MSLLIESVAHIVGLLLSIAIFGAWFFLFHKLSYGSLEFKSTAFVIVCYIAVIAGIIENNAEGIAGATVFLLIGGICVSFAYDSYLKLPLAVFCGYILSILVGLLYRMN